MHRVPIHFLELMSKEDTLFLEVDLCQLFVCPMMQALSLVRGEFVSTEEHTDWLKGKPFSGVSYCRFAS